MGRSFEVNTQSLSHQVEQLGTLETSLDTAIQGFEDVIGTLGDISSEFVVVRSFLRLNEQRLTRQKTAAGTLKAGLSQIISTYEQAENTITDSGPEVIRWKPLRKNREELLEQLEKARHHRDGRTVCAEDLDLYDDEGGYGGDQGALANGHFSDAEYQQCLEQVRKYHPDWDDERIHEYFKKMNSEGCGYTAAINTILAAYQGRDKEFEETFGFPRTNPDTGDLNYNRLLVDFYTTQDNHVKGTFGSGDRISVSETLGITKGVNSETLIYRTQRYMKQHGANVNITEIKRSNLDTRNFQETYRGKPVTVIAHNVTLYRTDGGHKQTVGGHCMVVTGVADDGRLIVSSWGREYYLDPSEGSQTYQVYDYE